jgi:hypothetical protein
MTTTRQTHMARSRFSRMPTPELVQLVARTSGGPNVRLMEELLSRCPEWEPGVVAGLNAAVAGAGAEHGLPSQPVWLAVVAGEMRWARAAPALLRMLRAVPLDDYVAGLAAAEALAKIGGAAVDGLVEVARAGEWWQRVWAYASLGWNPAPRARDALLAALPHERLLTDVVAAGLADQGEHGDIPALIEALGRCSPVHRAYLEAAIQDLHAGRRERPADRDWRLRYQINPAFGDVHPGRAGLALMARDRMGQLIGPPAQPRVRSLDEILAEPPPDPGYPVDAEGNPVCECCGASMWIVTGPLVCPNTAVLVTWIEHQWLVRAQDDARLDDLFDVFDLLDDELRELRAAPRPRRRKARARRRARSWEIELTWLGVCWFIEQGIEDVTPARARLVTEMSRLADLHGDPHGVLSRPEPGTPV